MAKKYLLQLQSTNEIKNADVDWHYDEITETAWLLLEVDGEKIQLTNESTESALKDLSTLLKNKYKIQSCFTCRYGNFCPVGNYDNEIFCMDDFEPKSKEDVYFFTEDAQQRKKRARTLFDICPKFKPCSKGYYTYK